MTDEADVKLKADVEFLHAQTEKIRAEIQKMQKEIGDRSDRLRSFLIESVKVVGAIVLGAGGAIAAFSGYQLSEVKRERTELEIEKKVALVEKKTSEIRQLEQQAKVLESKRAQAEADLVAISSRIAGMKGELSAIQEQLPGGGRGGQAQAAKALERVDGLFVGVESSLKKATEQVSVPKLAPDAAAVRKPQPTVSGMELDATVAKLFADSPQERVAALDRLTGQFHSDPRLVAAVVKIGGQNLGNRNGIFHALTILNNASREQLLAEASAVREFVGKASENGPKSKERANRVLEKLAG